MAPAEPLLELAEVMRRLRAECPWKRSQTHRSLARYLLEETYETLEVLDAADDDTPVDADHLREELGDLLLQVYFHAAIAEESGAFTLDDVARGLTEKLHRRNPHVFGPDVDGPSTQTPEEVDAAWQAIKATEQDRSSVTAGLPEALPALLHADKVLDRLSRRPATGRARPPEVAPAAPRGGSADPEHAIGERLLAVVADARAEGVDPEQALRAAVRRLLDLG